MNPIKVLVFAGSIRKDSLNKKLAKVAAAAVTKAGGEATYLDLKDYSMPFYDGDLESESGIPVNAKKFKEQFKIHDAIIIASPEYNSSFSPLLKNALDWASRTEKDEKALAAFSGKTIALMAASPGALGGLRGLVHLRSLLGNIQMLVLPEQIAIPSAHEAFNEDGTLKDQKKQEQIELIVKKLVTTTTKLAN